MITAFICERTTYC